VYTSSLSFENPIPETFRIHFTFHFGKIELNRREEKTNSFSVMVDRSEKTIKTSEIQKIWSQRE
jgi:hypothetical protein